MAPQASQDVWILGAGQGVMMAEGLLIGEGHYWGHWSLQVPSWGTKSCSSIPWLALPWDAILGCTPSCFPKLSWGMTMG